MRITRQQDEVLRDLCRHPALQVPPETVKFLLSTIVGARPRPGTQRSINAFWSWCLTLQPQLRSVTTLQLALMSLKCGSSMAHAMIQHLAPFLHRW
jgi:hypothetical protein